MWLVEKLRDKRKQRLRGFPYTSACGVSLRSIMQSVNHYDARRLRLGKLDANKRITCDRCAIIVDAALEGVKPFPFSLPGVPDEVLR